MGDTTDEDPPPDPNYSNYAEIFRMSSEMDVIFLDFQEEMVSKSDFETDLPWTTMGSVFPDNSKQSEGPDVPAGC